MVCKICGKQLPEGSTVCKYCGARVKSGSAGRPVKRRYSKKGLARRRMVNLVILILALIVIAAVIVGIVLSARQVGNPSQPEQDVQTSGNTEEPEPPEEPVVPKEEQTAKEPEETPEETPEEPEAPEETPEEPPEETPEEPEAPEEPTEEPAEQPPVPSGNYTISINRTETTASLNHYRELNVYINETLPEGVKVESTTWTSSDSSIVRAEDGKAWGVSLGEATVTGTILLSDGQSLSASCKVSVVESQIVTYSEYVLPESNTRLYTAEELSGLTASELLIARNEIYARHGRQFTNPELQTYFNGKSWYSGTIAPANFDASVLNSYERQNVVIIQSVEASR